MNHPQREEWVPYVFDEATPETRRRLKEHLAACSACREDLDSWQRSLGRLDAWRLPRFSRPAEILRPFLKWAAAAAMLFTLVGGVAVGRLITGAPDTARLKAALEADIRQQLQQEFALKLQSELAQSSSATLKAANQQAQDLLTDYINADQAKRAEDNQAILTALDRMSKRHLADYASLKQELDTVAFNTDVGLRHTEQQLVQLASYEAPSAGPNGTKP
jgi:hypothetical protein